MRSESAGGLKVKALGRTLRDLGSSPSWCLNFSCSRCLLKRIFNLLLNHIKQMRTYLVNGGIPLQCACAWASPQ